MKQRKDLVIITYDDLIIHQSVDPAIHTFIILTTFSKGCGVAGTKPKFQFCKLLYNILYIRSSDVFYHHWVWYLWILFSSKGWQITCCVRFTLISLGATFVFLCKPGRDMPSHFKCHLAMMCWRKSLWSLLFWWNLEERKHQAELWALRYNKLVFFAKPYH